MKQFDYLFKKKGKLVDSYFELCEKYDVILTMEEGCLAGGFGSAVIEYYTDMGNQIKVARMGIPDHFVEHGTRGELLDSLDLNGMGIVNKIKATLEELNE